MPFASTPIFFCTISAIYKWLNIFIMSNLSVIILEPSSNRTLFKFFFLFVNQKQQISHGFIYTLLKSSSAEIFASLTVTTGSLATLLILIIFLFSSTDNLLSLFGKLWSWVFCSFNWKRFLAVEVFCVFLFFTTLITFF